MDLRDQQRFDGFGVDQAEECRLPQKGHSNR